MSESTETPACIVVGCGRPAYYRFGFRVRPGRDPLNPIEPSAVIMSKDGYLCFECADTVKPVDVMNDKLRAKLDAQLLLAWGKPSDPSRDALEFVPIGVPE